MEPNSTYDQEINLKDLMFAILYQWRMILIAAVVFAALLGGYRGLKPPSAPSETQVAEAQEALADYNEILEYQENSLLMNMKPFNAWEGTIAFTAAAEEGVSADAILQAYSLALSDKKFLEPMAEAMDTELQYISELVTINANPGFLTLSVINDDEESVQAMMDDIRDAVAVLHPQIEEQMGKHELHEESAGIEKMAGKELAETQDLLERRITAMEGTANSSRSVLSAAEEGSAAIARRSIIKYAVLGCVLGAFLVVFVTCIGFMMSGRVYSAKQMRTYLNVRILGSLPRQGKKNVVDRLLRKLEGRIETGAEKREYDLIAVNMMNYLDGAKTVLVTGSASSDMTAAVTEQLKVRLADIRLIAEGSMLQNPEALKKLPECDGVVLVEESGRSVYGDIRNEIEKISDQKKDVIGFVVIE